VIQKQLNTERRGATDLGTARVLSPAALALVLVAAFVVVLDFSIVNVALPSIEQELGFSATSLQWVVTAYAITFGGLLILGGGAADRFGPRRMFLVGLFVFTAASLAGGLARDPGLLIAARAVQGIGAAIVAPAALTLITTGFHEGPPRNRALGLYGATASVGFVAGLMLGGLLVQLSGWRAVFFVNVPVGLLTCVLGLRHLPRSGARTMAGGPLDVAGGVLITASIASLVYAVSVGPLTGLGSPGVIGGLMLFTATLAGFVELEHRHAQPLIRFGMLKLRTVRSANAITLLLGIWSGGEMIVMTLYLQDSLHYSPAVTGLAMAPQGVVGLLAGLTGAHLAARLGIRRLLMLTTAMATVGFLILSQLPTTSDYPIVLLAVTLIGFGTAGTMFATTVGASTGVIDTEQGVAGGLVNTSRQVGAAIGAAVLLAVAEGVQKASGATTISGDRIAMLAAALVALTAAIVAWRGIKAPHKDDRTELDHCTEPRERRPQSLGVTPLGTGQSQGASRGARRRRRPPLLERPAQ
jgi:EmrB/QacA subfamily drug resistance transporter